MTRDVTKLPKWAQELLVSKDQEIERLKYTIENLEAAHNETGTGRVVQLNYGLECRSETNLPDRAQIRFYINREQRRYVDIGFRQEPDRVTIYVGQRMRLYPIASNSIKIGDKH